MNNKESGVCPKCNSNKVRTLGKLYWFLFLLSSGGCFIVIGLFLPIFFYIALALVAVSPFSILFPKVSQCIDCYRLWRIQKN
ncbi:hypothetical protein [Bacillus sp. Marseille-P3661]|uniref:hypothetical protein n=1 Tax=Bacillus sp. Marseille-P3661 TaxID=1936234 RepID=UPI000C8626D5|nr:hypothetical protein [Bacillus sp. Marseille-P3661]